MKQRAWPGRELSQLEELFTESSLEAEEERLVLQQHLQPEQQAAYLRSLCDRYNRHSDELYWARAVEAVGEEVPDMSGALVRLHGDVTGAAGCGPVLAVCTGRGRKAGCHLVEVLPQHLVKEDDTDSSDGSSSGEEQGEEQEEEVRSGAAGQQQACQADGRARGAVSSAAGSKAHPSLKQEPGTSPGPAGAAAGAGAGPGAGGPGGAAAMGRPAGKGRAQALKRVELSTEELLLRLVPSGYLGTAAGDRDKLRKLHVGATQWLLLLW